MFEVPEYPMAVVCDDPDDTLGDQIARLRENSGWTQADLAERAGVHINTVNNIENNRTAKLESIVLLAEALGYDMRVSFIRSK